MNINKICEVLEIGGLVITPTDTVYGIMGDALNETVIKKIYEVKKRPYSKPLILLMSSYNMIKDYTESISEKENEAIKKILPGPVTIIMKKNSKVSNLITGNGEYVGIRIPNNKELITIINKLGRPVVSTSANLSNEEVITNINMLSYDLKSQIDYVEDGGEVKNISSTIIKFNGEEIEIIREGAFANEIKEKYINKK